MHWLRHTDVTIVNYDRLTCLGHNDEEMLSEKNWDDYKKACSIWDEVIMTAVVSVLSTTAFFGLIKCVISVYRNRYSLKTYFFKLRLNMRGNSSTTYQFDVYICYVHDDDEVMEEFREFIEVKNKLKCCIPQRDFGGFDTDDVTAMEQSLERSASTMVLWSKAALASKWHKAEYKMARYIELYRSFNHRIIHVCLEDLSNVDYEDVKLFLRGGKHMQWISDATDEQKKKFFDRLGPKLFGRITCRYVPK